jgi:pimeloyl-ACP methyl ester carboxylesterase
MKAVRGAILAASFMMGTPATSRGQACEVAFKISEKKLSESAPVRGWILLSAHRKFFVDYSPPKNAKPTVVLLNGLTYSTKQWDVFAKQLIFEGYGVVRYDMFGMGQTLLGNLPVLKEIEYRQQVHDLKELLEKLNVPKPYNLVGLSYGGAIATEFGAQYPQLTGKLVLMAPFTKPVKEQDEWIKKQVALTRAMFPLNPATDAALYDYFLKKLIYSTYPLAEPISAEYYPHKLEAIFRMVQSVRHWEYPKAVQKLPEKSVHYMIAAEDQYIKADVMEEGWAAIGKAQRMSRIVIGGAEHKIPEAVPRFSAAWVAMILAGHPILQDGTWFYGNAKTGSVQYKDGELVLPSDE